MSELLKNGLGLLPSGLVVDILDIAVDMEAEGRPLFAKWLRLLSEESVKQAELAAQLDDLSGLNQGEDHAKADRILHESAPADVRTAYERLKKRSSSWWYE